MTECVFNALAFFLVCRGGYEILAGRQLQADAGAVKRASVGAPGGDLVACEALCDADPKCNYFSHNKETGICWFKEATPATTPAEDWLANAKFDGYLKKACKEGRVLRHI